MPTCVRSKMVFSINACKRLTMAAVVESLGMEERVGVMALWSDESMSGSVSGAMVSRATKDTPADIDDGPARALDVAAAASVGRKGPAEAIANNAAAKSFLYGFMQCAVFFCRAEGGEKVSW